MRCKICKQKIKEGEYYQRVQLSYIHKGKCLDQFIQEHIKKAKKNKKVKKVSNTSKLELTQRVFNKYIRVRDTRPKGIGYCISCGAKLELGTNNAQAGHYKSVGARSDLRFNEYNVHLQCLKCNKYGSREVWVVYEKNLIKKIGKDKLKELEKRTQQDYSEQNLKKIRKKYSKKIKGLLK